MYLIIFIVVMLVASVFCAAVVIRVSWVASFTLSANMIRPVVDICNIFAH